MNLLQKIFYGLALLLITLTIMLDRASGSVGPAGFAQVPSSKYYFPVITSGYTFRSSLNFSRLFH